MYNEYIVFKSLSFGGHVELGGIEEITNRALGVWENPLKAYFFVVLWGFAYYCYQGNLI